MKWLIEGKWIKMNWVEINEKWNEIDDRGEINEEWNVN